MARPLLPQAGAQPWARTRETIEYEIARYNRCIRDLKMELNTLSPVSILPPEVLSGVFLHVVGCSTKDTGHVPPSREWIRVSHVCKHWRDVALGCPALWSCLNVAARSEWLAVFLARSKSAPLSVSVSIRPPWLRDSRGRSTLPRRPESEESLILVLSSLERIRTLSIESMTAPSNEILKLLDGPAPLLESLSIFESAYGSKLRLTASRLLSRPESSRLRRLELTKCSLVWDSISLKNLTQLTLDGCGKGTKLVHVLGALSRMPRLEKLVIKGAFENLARNASTQTSRTQIYLPHLRSIRSTGDSPANCTCLLQSLYTPSLSYLYVGLGYEGTVSSESRGNRLLELVLAVATKAGGLGRLLTLAITLPASFNTSVCLYRDSCEATVGAKDDSTMSWIDKHNPALELHIPFAMGDGLWSAFCGQFPINSVSCLILQQYLPPMSMWLDLMRRVKMVTELRVYCARLLHSLPEILARSGHLQRDGLTAVNACQFALPNLRLLTLDRVRFLEPKRGSQLVPDEPGTIAGLIDCFAERREGGVEIRRLRILNPENVTEAELKKLEEAVSSVEWDGALDTPYYQSRSVGTTFSSLPIDLEDFMAGDSRDGDSSMEEDEEEYY